MLSIAIGIAAALLIGSCAVILALRFPCGRRRRRKDAHQNTTVRVASPGPSDKSVNSKDYDGNESDEKNPDVIPETMDSDDQVNTSLFTLLTLLSHSIHLIPIFCRKSIYLYPCL